MDFWFEHVPSGKPAWKMHSSAILNCCKKTVLSLKWFGAQCYDSKNIFAEKFSENIGVFGSNCC
jgi:hypothetical protein